MSPRARKPKRPEKDPSRRAEVLEAGLALIAESGVAGASLRELARRLGMSQPSLYHYFESKDELVRQIIDYCADRMLAPSAPRAMPESKAELPRHVVGHVMSTWTG